MKYRKIVVAGLFAFASLGSIVSAQTAPGADDPNGWLEEIEGEKPLAWARAENEKTFGVLKKDPRYQAYHDEALQILQAKARMPLVSIRADAL